MFTQIVFAKKVYEIVVIQIQPLYINFNFLFSNSFLSIKRKKREILYNI